MKLVKTKGPTKLDTRRRRLREEKWKGAASFVWDRADERGFVTIPRTLPLLASLIKHLSAKNDASRVYLDLWGRVYDQGVVEVHDEKQFAMSAGYPDNSRNVRSWQERMAELEKLGFILTEPSAARKYGFVLVLHPHAVVELMHRQDASRIPDWWWRLYRERISEIGAKLPDVDKFAEFVTQMRKRKAS
jgi:hypothetical protein